VVGLLLFYAGFVSPMFSFFVNWSCFLLENLDSKLIAFWIQIALEFAYSVLYSLLMGVFILISSRSV